MERIKFMTENIENDLKEIVDLLYYEETFPLGLRILENKGYIFITATIIKNYRIHYNFTSKKCTHYFFIQYVRRLRKNKNIQNKIFSNFCSFTIYETLISWRESAL